MMFLGRRLGNAAFTSFVINLLIAYQPILGDNTEVGSSSRSSQKSGNTIFDNIGEPNPFGQKDLTITSDNINDRKAIQIARGLYKSKDVHVTCARINGEQFPEMQAYKSLKDLQGTVENADGAEFVKQVVHDFEWNGMQCFVTPSRCDKTLEYYTAHIPNQQKHDLLLKLMIQVLHGTAYLHRHNTTYNDFTPTTICVNSDKRSEPKALLFNFKKSSFLKFVTEKKVFLNFPHRPYVLDSQEWKMEQYVDMRKQDLWNIAALFYALLFNISPYKDSQKLYEHREDMTSFNLRRFTSIQYRSRLLTKMIKDMLVWNSKERPTPEEYLESAKFISESK